MNGQKNVSRLESGSVIRIEAAAQAASACRVLTRNLEERGFKVTQESAPLTITLSLTVEAGEAEGEFIITAQDNTVVIASATPAGLLYGIGEFLRQAAFHADGSLSIPELSLHDKPRMPWRAVMTCYHNQDNGYKYWDIDRERLYMEDMALWGSSMAMFSPLNMWQRNSRTLQDGTPENDAWKTMASMPAVADELGLGYGMLNVPNDVFKDDLEHCRQSTAGAGQMLFAETACACPSDPRAWEIILRRRDEFFAKMARVDFLYIHPSDYGGCSCEECGPYIPTYLALAKDVAACMRRHHPNAKVYIGTVLITEEGMRQYVLPYMNSPESDWLDGIVYGMHGTALSLTEIREGIPERFQIVLYPEITMAENWGRLGASPWVKHFGYSLERKQDMAKECIRLNAWPNTSERMFGEQFPISFKSDEMADMISGAFVYSEGLHDDIAKVIWLRYCWDPDEPQEEALAEYCRMYYGEEAAEKAAEAILLMEEISFRRDSKLFCPPLTYNDDGTGYEKSCRIIDLLEEMKELMPGWARQSWRFKFLELRAHLDRAAFIGRDGEVAQEEKEFILDLGEEIYHQTLHVNILPAGARWNREKGMIYLEKLLTTPEVAQIVPPVSPVIEL